MNNRRLLIISAVVLVVIGGLLFSAHDFIRDAIVIPISYWIWVLTTLSQVLPQYYYWILVMVIAAVIAYRSFRSARRLKREPEPMIADIGPGVGGRVEYWASRVNLMRYGPYYQSTFNEALGRLALDLLSYRNRLSYREIERNLNKETLIVPKEVRAFLVQNVLRRSFQPTSYLVYLYRVVRLYLYTHLPSSRARRQNLPAQARQVLEYIEEELEIHYDHSGE